MKIATTLSALLFSLMAIAHLARLVLRVEVIAGGHVVPMWVSVIGLVVPGALAMGLFRESRT